jgi:uncharacterized membrane protein YgdD (TMEM256/DUF423 family)
MMIAAGAFCALTGVGAGAFGAHGLRAILEPAQLGTFETAVRYQMYHAVALVALGLAHTRWPSALWSAAAWAHGLGILLFSGSLYLMVLTPLRSLGWLTPLGGAAFITGWLAMIAASLTLRRASRPNDRNAAGSGRQ